MNIEFNSEQIALVKYAAKKAVSALLEAQKHSSTTGSPNVDSYQVASFIADSITAIIQIEEYDESFEMVIDE